MARMIPALSNETKDLLESKPVCFACLDCLICISVFAFFSSELSDENHLSVVKRKGLVEHLMRSSQQPRGCQEAYGPRQRPFIRRSKTHLDNLKALRKKETIVQSGAYERSHIAPPKGRGKIVKSDLSITRPKVLKYPN